MYNPDLDTKLLIIELETFQTTKSFAQQESSIRSLVENLTYILSHGEPNELPTP